MTLTGHDAMAESLGRLRPLIGKAIERAGGPAPSAGVRPAGSPGTAPSGAELAAFIDHTLLKAGSTAADIERLCAEARRYGFAAVCVNSGFVARCAAELAGTSVRVASTVGFPLGACTPEVKAFETEQAIQAGASEIDMVADIGALRSGDYAQAARDMLAVIRPAHEASAVVKVILEMGALSQEAKIAGCLLAAEAGADFAKTSTGFGPGGATVEDVALMRFVLGDRLGVKAAGGIRTVDDALAMIRAGANRLGTSSGVQIMQQALGVAAPAGPERSGY
ncbi:MAG: deoxyribose-phosphate aldolase [Chloroflexota bacterium]